MNIFLKVKQKADKAKEIIQNKVKDADKLFLAGADKILGNPGPGADFFFWEYDDEVDYCRDCCKKFNNNKLTNTKLIPIGRSHCRNCGGIYCNDCLVQYPELDGKKLERCCKGCLRGEVPGDKMRIALEKLLCNTDIRNNRKVTGFNVGLKHVHLEELHTFKKRPKQGYFEFINKQTTFCCIKVISGNDGTDLATTWEIPRPSYIAVPPNGVVNGEFDPLVPIIEIIILTGNTYNIKPDEEIIYNTLSNKPEAISPCAVIKNFKRYTSYRILSKNRNVVVKFKKTEVGNKLEARKGSGFFSARKDHATRTNIDEGNIILLSTSASKLL